MDGLVHFPHPALPNNLDNFVIADFSSEPRFFRRKGLIRCTVGSLLSYLSEPFFQLAYDHIQFLPRQDAALQQVGGKISR